MKVFKFGGASVKDAAGVKNVVNIIKRYASENLVVIVSASGKTTNALEEVVNAFFHQKDHVEHFLDKVRKHHEDILNELFEKNHPIYDELYDHFAEIEWIIEEEALDAYDYVYDQVVSIGEFLSTRIVAAYLNKEGMNTHWLDVRDIIQTDSTYREGNINWEETEKRANSLIPKFIKNGIVLTQGFVGGTSENTTTTLGREGSDFTGAIIAHCLKAQSMTIWKDVPGVLTADPRLFENAKKLDHISYEEAIEMTYYGAQVIHPKTMRPLQIYNIPLYVKSFIHPESDGTLVDGTEVLEAYPPVIVVKKNQVLLKISTKDFYFINEEKLSDLFIHFNRYRMKINLMQNTAMQFLVCLDHTKDRLEKLLEELNQHYNVSYDENLELITIRHYDIAQLDYFKHGRKVLLEEKIHNTAQLVLRVLNDEA